MPLRCRNAARHYAWSWHKRASPAALQAVCLLGCCGSIGLSRTIHPHPTLSESIGMAAEVFEGVESCAALPVTSLLRRQTQAHEIGSDDDISSEPAILSCLPIVSFR